MVQTSATGAVKGLEEFSVRALMKVEPVLPKRLRRRVNALNVVSVRLGDAGPRVDAETMAVLANACRGSEVLRFDYLNREGTATARSVELYRLVHTSHRWYLLAYDLERGDDARQRAIKARLA